MFQCFIFKNVVEEQIMLNVVRITTINKKRIMKYAQKKKKIIIMRFSFACIIQNNSMQYSSISQILLTVVKSFR